MYGIPTMKIEKEVGIFFFKRYIYCLLAMSYSNVENCQLQGETAVHVYS